MFTSPYLKALKRITLSLVLVIISFSSGLAATIVAAGGEWTTGASWVGGVAPVSGTDDVYIPAGVTITITDTGLFTPLNYNGNISIDGTLGLVSGFLSASGLSMDGGSSITIGATGQISSTFVPFFGSPDPNYITMGFLNFVYSPTLNGDPSPATGPATITPGGGLPIELLLFTGKQASTLVQLDWETASELNNDFFTLQRSYDGSEFETIATIDGAGNSNEAISYSLEDLPTKSGVIYYQLSQTDFDGTSETFDIIGVRYKSSSELIQVYPNPLAGNALTVLFPQETTGKVEVNIYSLSGKSVYQEEFDNPGNSLIINLDEPRSKGMYLLEVITESEGFTSKLYLE